MSTTRPPRLGTCPECDSIIASTDVTLDANGDQPALYTECSACRELVNPE